VHLLCVLQLLELEHNYLSLSLSLLLQNANFDSSLRSLPCQQRVGCLQLLLMLFIPPVVVVVVVVDDDDVSFFTLLSIFFMFFSVIS